MIAAGSDFPVESANPFYGLHASVTRQDHDNQPDKGWYADESMNISQALTSFTTAAAFSAHQEELIGSLAKGMKADFIFIDRDIVKDDASEIWQAEVLQTWVDGKVIFDIENYQR